MSLCAPLPLFYLRHFFRAGLSIVPRSLLLNRTETLATRAKADRESSVTLCHGVVLKKKGSVEDRESGVALCHGMALKKKGSVEDRESGVALRHKVALKHRGGAEEATAPAYFVKFCAYFRKEFTVNKSIYITRECPASAL